MTNWGHVILMYMYHHLALAAECHSSVGSVADLRTGGGWFNPRVSQYSFQGLMSHCDRVRSSLTTDRCFDNGYMGKQPVAWEEYCAEYWLKELQGSMDRCIDPHDITEILFENDTKHHIINQSYPFHKILSLKA